MRDALKEHKGECCHFKQWWVDWLIPSSPTHTHTPLFLLLTGVITCIKIRRDDEEVGKIHHWCMWLGACTCTYMYQIHIVIP